MSTTVTMDLARFKELEGKEKAFEGMLNNREMIVIHVPYGPDYFIHVSQEQAFEQIKKEIKQVSDLAESWRQKAIK